MLTTHSTILRATLELARRVDRAEIDFCALAGAHGVAGIDRLEAGGGLALHGKPGSPFNKVLGLGLAGAVSDDDLDRIEEFYKNRRSPAQIELCPMAYADLPARLGARGFVLNGFEAQLSRGIEPRVPLPAVPDGVRVSTARADQEDLWTRVVAEGFGAAEAHVGGGPEHETFTTEQVVEMMQQFRHPGMRRYLAWIDGRPAGGGSSWVLDGVLGIAGTSTLPPFRRQGVQTAIAVQALRDAAGEADLAAATTAPGSTSQRTFERLGFQVLYTRAILVKSFSHK